MKDFVNTGKQTQSGEAQSQILAVAPKNSGQPERGNALILVTVFIVALFGFSALSIDVSNVLMQRHKMHERTDAVSLAAARDWAAGNTKPTVIALGRAFAVSNGWRTNDTLTIEPGLWNPNAKLFVEYPLNQLNFLTVPIGFRPAVRVTEQRTVNAGFGRVVGFPVFNPWVKSVAIAAQAKCFIGALPFGVCDQTGFISNQCTKVTLKFSSATTGTNSCSDTLGSANFGALRLPGNTGAADYRRSIINGYFGELCVGDCITFEPGNMQGPTRDAMIKRLEGLPPYVCTANPPSLPPTNLRMAVIPNVNVLVPNGVGEVCITGFYVVALKDPVVIQGQLSVDAEYVTSFSGGVIDPTVPCTVGVVCGLGLVE